MFYSQRNTLGQPPFLLSWFLSHLLMYGLTYLIHTKWSLPRYLALRHAAEARRKLVLAAAAEPRARARTQIAPHLTGKLFGVQCSDFTAAEMEAIVAAARKRCDALSRTAPLLEVSCFDGCVILLLQGITVAEASAEETEESAQSSFSLSADDLLEALPERLRQKITLARAGAAARQPAVETIDRLALPAWETTRVRVAFSGLEEAELHLWRPAVTSTARKSELQPLAFDWTYAAGTRTATLHCTLPPLPHLEVLHVGAKKIVAEAEAAAAGPDAAFLSSMRPLLVLGPDHLADLTAIARPGVAADIATYAGSLNAAFGRVPAGRRRDRVRITTASGLAALAAPAAATVAVLEGVPRGGRHLLSLFDGEILPALAGEKSWAWPQQGGAMGLSLQFEDPAMERLWLDTFVRDVSTPASRFFRVFFALSPFVRSVCSSDLCFFCPRQLVSLSLYKSSPDPLSETFKLHCAIHFSPTRTGQPQDGRLCRAQCPVLPPRSAHDRRVPGWAGSPLPCALPLGPHARQYVQPALAVAGCRGSLAAGKRQNHRVDAEASFLDGVPSMDASSSSSCTLNHVL